LVAAVLEQHAVEVVTTKADDVIKIKLAQHFKHPPRYFQLFGRSPHPSIIDCRRSLP
jgi:hypothetical protein